MLMFSGIVLLTPFPFFGALPEASAMPNDDRSTQLAEIELLEYIFQYLVGHPLGSGVSSRFGS